jgi:hypothetical protein
VAIGREEQASIPFHNELQAVSRSLPIEAGGMNRQLQFVQRPLRHGTTFKI